jgi:hypothetical protein
MSKCSCIIKAALMIAIVALSVLAVLYVLDVFPAQEVKDALIKSMKVIGIFTAACLLLWIIGCIGDKKGSCGP